MYIYIYIYLTNFFQPVNHSSWPAQSLYMPLVAHSGQATPAHSALLITSLVVLASALYVPQLEQFGIDYQLTSQTIRQFNYSAIN